jgi:parallel beta-helix repeat protein
MKSPKSEIQMTNEARNPKPELFKSERRGVWTLGLCHSFVIRHSLFVIFPWLLLSILNPQLSTVFAQGSLTPPGPPAPTMKTLQQVEPRTPISQTNVPYVINIPGSYYLTENLFAVGFGTTGIVVNAQNVTLDLKGFTIANSEVGQFQYGIVIASISRNVTVRDGTVLGAQFDGVTAGTFGGPDCQFRNLRLLLNGRDGLVAGNNAVITGCTASGNGDDGFVTGIGCTLNQCAARENGDAGFATGGGNTLTASAASSNAVTGMFLGPGNNATDCTAYSNGGVGFRADFGSTIRDCTAYLNGGDGIDAGQGCTITGCTAQLNTDDGIEVSGGCLVEGNTGRQNGNDRSGAGIHATANGNRIDGNIVSLNDRGIDVDAGGNVIVRNSATGNTTEYDIFSPGNSVGPILTLADPITSTNPWANFDH